MLQLTEATRNQLINKSKSSQKGKERLKRKNRSSISKTVKEFNSIDMNKLFKEDILTVNIKVNGETNNYIVRITMGGFLDKLHNILNNNQLVDLRIITKALIQTFNSDNVYVNCQCPDFLYRYSFVSTQDNYNSGEPQSIPANITNPDDSLGSACKHVLLVLSNTSWLLKVASVVNNYVNYMEKHYKKAYQTIIYPAIYNKEYEEPIQQEIDDVDKLAGEEDSEILDTANEYGRTRSQFKTGNQMGIKFAKKDLIDDDEQITIFNEE